MCIKSKAKMMSSFVHSRKRKDSHNVMIGSPEKGKVRVVEKTREGTHESQPKLPRLRSTLPNTRAIAGLRRGSVKIFSVFRSPKGVYGLRTTASLLIY